MAINDLVVGKGKRGVSGFGGCGRGRGDEI